MKDTKIVINGNIGSLMHYDREDFTKIIKKIAGLLLSCERRILIYEKCRYMINKLELTENEEFLS